MIDNSQPTASDFERPLFLLFVIFLILKLTGVIFWSWWWITVPLWGPLALALVVLIVIVFPLRMLGD